MDQYLVALSIDDIFSMSHVSRYHTEHTIRVQSVAEHSLRVTLMAVKALYYLYTKHNWCTHAVLVPYELEIYRYGLTHDVEETDGDMPSYMKRVFLEQGVDVNKIQHQHYWGPRGISTEDREVTPQVKALVSFFDSLEGYIFASAHIPQGTAKVGVLTDWEYILRTKIKKFQHLFPAEYLYNIFSARDNYVDHTWI